MKADTVAEIKSKSSADTMQLERKSKKIKDYFTKGKKRKNDEIYIVTSMVVVSEKNSYLLKLRKT